MMLYPAHTIDGGDLSPAERDAAPLIGRIDQPAVPDVEVERDVCRFEGWAVSDPLCGFAYDVDLSRWPGGSTVEVVVELDDGKYRARSEPYRVSLPDDR